jgi:hypothetical protein
VVSCDIHFKTQSGQLPMICCGSVIRYSFALLDWIFFRC